MQGAESEGGTTSSPAATGGAASAEVAAHPSPETPPHPVAEPKPAEASPPPLPPDGAPESLNEEELRNIHARLLPPSKEPYQLSAAVEEKGGYVSQFGQDRWVDEFLQQRTGLFAVESGAYDGEGYSNTLFLELHRNWDCLLIEASPTMQEKLVNKHRKAHVFLGGISITSAYETFDFKLAGSNSGFLKTYSDKHSAKVDGDLLNQRWWMHEDKGEVVTVPCWPLHEILLPLQRTVVDYWSLDTEGSEPEILQHTRFDLIEVGLITVEHNREQDRKELIMTILEAHGFMRVKEADIEDYYANLQYCEKRGIPCSSTSSSSAAI